MRRDPVPAAADLLRKIPPLAMVDGVAIFAFVLIGGDVHGTVRPAGVLRTLVFLLVPWYAVAAYVGLYRQPSWRSFLRTWAVAIPLGVLVRQIWVGRLLSSATLIFLAAALVLTLVFLVAARWLADVAGLESSS